MKIVNWHGNSRLDDDFFQNLFWGRFFWFESRSRDMARDQGLSRQIKEKSEEKKRNMKKKRKKQR